jgi:hypothetical protein
VYHFSGLRKEQANFFDLEFGFTELTSLGSSIMFSSSGAEYFKGSIFHLV